MSTPGIERGADPVERIMASFFDLEAAELPAAVEAACAEHPEHAGEILRRMRAVRFVFESGGAHRSEAGFPETLGDFRLIERLGGGGMGVVYRAEQRSLGRDVALKIIRPELLFFAGARARFRRETEAVARLQHPGIVAIHTVGEENGLPFFAMELLPGRTLSAALSALASRAPETLDGSDLGRSGTWVEACVEIVRQLALAVEHAHQRGILHRDVKPSNAMLLPDGRVVLLDFGLTSFAGHAADERMTRTGSQVGTLAYMSPEQLRAGKDVDERADVYALGVTLYELLTLQVPYREESPIALQTRIIEGAPDSIRARNRRVPRDVEIVCLHAMEARPQDRYPGAAALAHDLSNAIALRPIEARPPGAVTRTVRWAQRRPARALAGALAVLLATGLPTGLYVQQRLFTSRLQESLESETRAKEKADEEAEVARQVTDFLDELFGYASPDRSLGEDIPVSFILEQGAQRIENELRDQPAVRARLLQTLGLAYDWLGSDENAEHLLGGAYELMLDLEGPGSPGTLQARINWARSLGHLGRYSEAERVLAGALTLDTGGEEDRVRSLLATTLNDHGFMLSNLGRTEEAEAELVRAVEIQRSVAGGLHLGMATCEVTLAGFLADMGRPGEARPVYEEALALYEALFPEGSPRTLALRASLARTLLDLGDAEAASRHAMAALGEARRIYGPEHVNVAPHLIGLASIDKVQGDAREAERLLRAALAIEENATAPDRGSIVWILNDLGTLLLERGDHEEAEELLRRALAVERSIHGKDHPRQAIVMANLADAWSRLGRLAEAEALARDSVAMGRRLGASTAAARSTLAWILTLQGRQEEAIACARAGLAEDMPKVPDGARIEGSLHMRLAFVHDQRGEGRLAEEEALAALELESVDRLYRALGLYILGWARELQGDPDGAAESWILSIEMFHRLFPEGHPDSMWVLNHHGGALLRAGRADEALPFLEEAVAIARRSDPGPYWTAVVLGNAGAAKTELGDYAEAEELLLEARALCTGAPELAELLSATDRRLAALHEARDRKDATRGR